MVSPRYEGGRPGGSPHGTPTPDWAPSALFVKAKPRGWNAGGESPLSNAKYGRWVPGGDSGLMVEELADKVIAGDLDYRTAVHLVEALTDAVGKRIGLGKRDLLMVLSRKREAHHVR
jgi:hypothetical protein